MVCDVVAYVYAPDMLAPFSDTTTRCVTIQTPSIFVDLRIQPTRDKLLGNGKCGPNFEGLSCEELVRLGTAEQVYSVVSSAS